MNFKTKLDFCVIPNPYSKGQKNLLFVAYSGTNNLDEKLRDEEDYELLRFTLSKYGYREIESCVFESSNNTMIHPEELKHNLAEAGLRYSKPLEFNVVGELNSFNQELIVNLGSSPSMQHAQPPVPIPANEAPLKETKPKIKIPNVGDKIELYFYMFMQCNFISEKDCILELIGDLHSKENSNTRNYLQIFKSEFIRMESANPNLIVLKSTKTYADFLNELSLLHKGAFRFVVPSMDKNGDMVTKTKEFTYNLLEIKRNINPIHKIAMKVNPQQYYDAMDMSKKIKKELTNENKRIVLLEKIRPDILSLKQKLNDKMIGLANSDEFEKANIVKEDIKFIDEKLKFIDNSETKKITRKEFIKTFCLNS